MSSIYLGRALGVAGFERLVAVKVCNPQLSEDIAFARMFLDEARLAAKIHHPNVVATLDVGAGQPLYLVMEYVEGADLQLVQQRHAQVRHYLPIPIAVSVAADALAGLGAAHALQGPDGRRLGLVHRDVSPQNVLIGTDGVSRIVDFGIAQVPGASAGPAPNAGKIAYMSPELLQGPSLRSHDGSLLGGGRPVAAPHEPGPLRPPHGRERPAHPRRAPPLGGPGRAPAPGPRRGRDARDLRAPPRSLRQRGPVRGRPAPNRHPPRLRARGGPVRGRAHRRRARPAPPPDPRAVRAPVRPSLPHTPLPHTPLPPPPSPPRIPLPFPRAPTRPDPHRYSPIPEGPPTTPSCAPCGSGG